MFRHESEYTCYNNRLNLSVKCFMHLLLSFLLTVSFHPLLPKKAEQQLGTSRHIWSSLLFRFQCSVPVELNQPAATQRWTHLWLFVNDCQQTPPKPLLKLLLFHPALWSFFRRWSWFVGWCSPLCDLRGLLMPRSYRSSLRVCEPKENKK